MLAPKSRIQSTMKKFKRLGFLPEDVSLTDICQIQDNNLFSQILSDENLPEPSSFRGSTLDTSPVEHQDNDWV